MNAITQSSRELSRFLTFIKGKELSGNFEDVTTALNLSNGAKVYLYGDVYYYIESTADRVKLIGSHDQLYLEKLFSSEDLETIIPRLEGQYIGIYVDGRARITKIFSDRYARQDCFYTQKDGQFILATELERIFEHTTPEYDPLMFAHMFAVYGWYTPKGKTVYVNVKQLQSGEIIELTQQGVKSSTLAFKPLDVKEYGSEHLETYYNILKDSITARVSDTQDKVWVSSSSGWDSSITLGMLVDIFGKDKIGMMAGSMHYSDQTGTINKFEMDKIKKIGDFFGIKPHVVDLDFKSTEAPNYWKSIAPRLKSKHSYTFTGYNFGRISDGVAKVSGPGQRVFNGETSDSFHNFGFSQFVTFFHTQKTFTEYGDKMNCYLYSPSFLKKVMEGSYKKDKVYMIFQKMTGAEFNEDLKGREELLEGFLFPLFYGGPRVPFAKSYNNVIFTEKGKRDVYHFPFKKYMPDVLKELSEKNLYSWIIYLYLNFHSQGSTVNIHKYAMELNNHKCLSPFNDLRMINLLSQAPESWGRGLNFNHTKYPLKWVAQNKIKFPYELLQEGPHSYLYDVIEGFSLLEEIVYRSAMTEFFKESLADKSYHQVLVPEYFNISYLDKVVDSFLNGKEVKGADFNNLVSVITLVITGWY